MQEHAVVCLSVGRVLGWIQGAGHFDTLLRPGTVLGSGDQSMNFIVWCLRSGLGISGVGREAIGDRELVFEAQRWIR